MEDKRYDILETLEGKSDEEIDIEFSDIVRNVLNEEQFKEYVFSWIDGDWLCDIMEGWEPAEKRRAIRTLKEKYKWIQ
jgi:hypothetical protein